MSWFRQPRICVFFSQIKGFHWMIPKHCDIRQEDNQQCDTRTQQLRYCIHCVDVEKMVHAGTVRAVYCAPRGAFLRWFLTRTVSNLLVLISSSVRTEKTQRMVNMATPSTSNHHCRSFFVLIPPNMLLLHLLAMYKHRHLQWSCCDS